MKTPLLALLALLLFSPLGFLRAAEEATLAAADEARVAAFLAADKPKLEGLLSDELHYGHASGAVDTKATLIEALATEKLKYISLAYTDRKFTFPAPTIALMTGRVKLQVKTATGVMDAEMSFLAAWREEGGTWRFLAWQSSKLPPAAGAPATK